jgi:proteasome lid subunit RPN8/RPN11
VAPRYPPGVLARVAALCEAAPEREACGFVVHRGGTTEVVPIPNVADRLHAADPGRFPRTGREAYVMDPGAVLRVHEALDREGGVILAVWHSHVDRPAHLSADDRDGAVVDGAPVLPGAEQLVVALVHGRAAEVRRFGLEGGALVERPLAAP